MMTKLSIVVLCPIVLAQSIRQWRLTHTQNLINHHLNANGLEKNNTIISVCRSCYAVSKYDNISDVFSQKWIQLRPCASFSRSDANRKQNDSQLFNFCIGRHVRYWYILFF